MAEETPNGSFPDLKELEDKVGLKTPERLVVWMRDAAHCEGWSSVADGGDTFSHQINSLRQEMRWLRSADVRILRQLLTVHEGIEAMRWLMEERSNLASWGSSLTGSLSSLVTMDEPFTSSCRASPNPPCPQDSNTDMESADQPLHEDDTDSKGKHSSGVQSHGCDEARPPSPSTSMCEISPSMQWKPHQIWRNPAAASTFNSTSFLRLQPQDLEVSPLQDMKTGADPIRGALFRSMTATRTGAAEGTECFSLKQPQMENFSACHKNMMEEEKSVSSKEELLLGYDAQWCWVESEDDVTFL